VAQHLVKRTYSEPRWSRKRGSVVATERVTLYGLPIVEGRTVAYGRIDPGLSRELFIRRALVERDWDTRHAFFAENGRRLEEVAALEDRARRRDLLAGDDELFAFFDARIPEEVVSAGHFDRWLREAEPDLVYPRELLVRGTVDEGGRPTTWRQGDLELELGYRFEPGAEHDGVTVHVPLKVLPRLRSAGFDWLVPAFRLELVTALLRALPKELRTQLVPVPDTAAAVVAQLRPRRGPLVDQVAEILAATRNVRVPPDAWDASRLPPHLRMNFRVTDERGAVVAEGTDLEALRATAAGRLRAELSAASAGIERSRMTAWELGELPRSIELPGTGGAVRGFPALVDEGESAGVRILETPEAQGAAMRAGTRRLLLATIPRPKPRLTSAQQLSLADAPAATIDDAIAAAVDALVREPAWDADAFARLRAHVAGSLTATAERILATVAEILDAARAVRLRAEGLTAPPFRDARRDVELQVARLTRPGFVLATGAARLPDVLRYLRAASRRLERLPDNPAVDRDRMRAIHELEQAYERRREGGRPLPEVPWLLEELRVSQFAQGLGTRQPVSAKRIRRAIDA